MSKVAKFISTHVQEIVTAFLIILIFIASGIARSDIFSAKVLPEVINSILMWMPLNLTVAMGMMMVVIIRGIDLSVGSTVALSAMVAGIMFRDLGTPLWLGIIVSVVIGIICGALNGAMVAYLKIPAIIVTLGTMNAYRGLTFIISAGDQVTNYDLPEGISLVSSQGVKLGNLLVPWLVIIAIAIAVFFYFIMTYTHFGREVYAVGSNREAAHLRGINCKKTEFLVFTITGALCGITGMMSAARFGYVNPSNTGNGLEFVVISATIIGGVSVSGGAGRVAGVFLGCLLLGTVNTMISTVGIPGTVQRFCYGIIIVLALLIDRFIHVAQEKKRIKENYGKEIAQ